MTFAPGNTVGLATRFVLGNASRRGGNWWPPQPRRVEHGIEERQCSKCKDWWLWPDQFVKSKNCPGGRMRRCKACRSDRRKTWRRR